LRAVHESEREHAYRPSRLSETRISSVKPWNLRPQDYARKTSLLKRKDNFVPALAAWMKCKNLRIRAGRFTVPVFRCAPTITVSYANLRIGTMPWLAQCH
jgi:hypothetical protein